MGGILVNCIEHPDISCALLTGHPIAVREPMVIQCEYCEKEMSGDDEVFDYDGDIICECCFLEQLQNDLSANDIARKLGFRVLTASMAAEEQEEYSE